MNMSAAPVIARRPPPWQSLAVALARALDAGRRPGPPHPVGFAGPRPAPGAGRDQHQPEPRQHPRRRPRRWPPGSGPPAFPTPDMVVRQNAAAEGQPGRPAPRPADREEADPAAVAHRRRRGRGRRTGPCRRSSSSRRTGSSTVAASPTTRTRARSHLALIMRMKQERYVPDRDIIVALTTDEEGGPDNGVEWLIKNHRDLINAEFALNEGGGGRVRDGQEDLPRRPGQREEGPELPARERQPGRAQLESRSRTTPSPSCPPGWSRSARSTSRCT